MKHLEDPSVDEDGEYVDTGIVAGYVDWKAGPGDVLEEIDRLLANMGLEIHSYNTESDTYAFSIQPRESKA